MTAHRDPEAEAALRGFTEMFQDRLPHVPAPAAGAMAAAVYAVAAQRRWETWPTRVELDGGVLELPAALHELIADIRTELVRDLDAGEVGAADVAVVRAIVERLHRFPPGPA